MFERIHPATVKSNHGYHYVQAAILHRDGLVRVFLREGHAARMVLDAKLLKHEQRSLKHHVLWLEMDGEQSVWDVIEQRGCGCASKNPLDTLLIDGAFP